MLKILVKWLSIFSVLFLTGNMCAYAQTAAVAPLPRLKTVGNHLETVNKKPITLRGVSLCGLGWQDSIGDIAKASAPPPNGWNANVIRIPVQPKEWHRVGAANFIKDFLDPAIAACEKNRVYCVIDWHEIRPWQLADKNEQLEIFWNSVAPRYANKPNILYEVFNEPTNPAERTRDTWLSWRNQAQKWVTKIRAMAPETVILVNSPHWSQMPNFAVADPFSGKNLVYVMHLYPGWSTASWNGFIGIPSKVVPIFISEWGWSNRDETRNTAFYGSQTAFGEPLKAFLDKRPHINWTAWSYHTNCGPAMLGPDADMGNFVKTWLHQVNDSKR